MSDHDLQIHTLYESEIDSGILIQHSTIAGIRTNYTLSFKYEECPFRFIHVNIPKNLTCYTLDGIKLGIYFT